VQTNSNKTRSKVAKQLTSAKLDFRKIAPKVDL
jgi:hypothetical protein